MAVPMHAVGRISQFLQKGYGSNPNQILDYKYDPSSGRASLFLFGRGFQFVHTSENVAKEGVYRAALCRNILDTVLERMVVDSTTNRLLQGKLSDLTALVIQYSDMTTLGDMPVPRSTSTTGASSAQSSPSLPNLTIVPTPLPSATSPNPQPGIPPPFYQLTPPAVSAEAAVATSKNNDVSSDTIQSSTSTPTSASTHPSIFSLSDHAGTTGSITPSSSTSISAADNITSRDLSVTNPWSKEIIPTSEGGKPSYRSKTPEADLAVWQRLAREPAPVSAYERLETFISTHFGQCRNPAVYQPYITFRFQNDNAILSLLGRDADNFSMRADSSPSRGSQRQFYKEELAYKAIQQGFIRDSIKRKQPKAQFRVFIEGVIRKYSDLNTLAVNTPHNGTMSPSVASIATPKGVSSSNSGTAIRIAGNAERMKASATHTAKIMEPASKVPEPQAISRVDTEKTPAAASSPVIPTGPAAMAMSRSSSGSSTPSTWSLPARPASATLPERPIAIPTGPRSALDLLEVIKSKPAGLPDRPKSMRGLSLPSDGMQKVYLDGKIVLMPKTAAASASGDAVDKARAQYGSSPPTGPRQAGGRSREDGTSQLTRESSRLSEGPGERDHRPRAVSIRGSADSGRRAKSQELRSDPYDRHDDGHGTRSRARDRSRSPSRDIGNERRRSRRSEDEEDYRRHREREEDRDRQRRRRSRSRSYSRERRYRKERRRSSDVEKDESDRRRKRQRSEETTEKGNGDSSQKDRRASDASDERRSRKRRRNSAVEPAGSGHADLDPSSVLDLVVKLAQGKLDHSSATKAVALLGLPSGLEKTALATLQAVHEASPEHLLKKANIEAGTDVVMLPRSWVEETRQLLLAT